jgi:bifunctional oligoribonuclease and PAP phosphatase NrnA
LAKRLSVPENLKFLPGAGDVKTELSPKDMFDMAVSVDCGSLDRLGEKFVAFKGYKSLLNIDHHVSNEKYGDLNYVIGDAASTGVVVWDILKALGCKLDSDIATNIYCTLVTDTGSFRYSNTTSQTLALAAEMVEAGASPDLVARNLYQQQPLVSFELLGRTLSRIKTELNGLLAWSVIYQKDLKETGANYEMSEGFIDYPRAIKGVEVAALFKEQPDGHYRLSLRSKTKVDVSTICGSFGGGGHIRAAGCTIKASIESACKEVFSKVEEALKKH